MSDIYGTTGNDSLLGTNQSDVIYGFAGDDTMDGGAGFDYLAYSQTMTIGISVNLETGFVSGGAGNDTILNIEGAFASAFNDTLVGDAGENYFWGYEGDDSINGGAGNDHLEPGMGFDTVDGGDGFDYVEYNYEYEILSAVTVNLETGVVSGGGEDILTNIEGVWGSTYNDILIGNSAANVLWGNIGNDSLRGGAGNDTLEGFDGIDTAVYSGSRVGYTVSTSSVVDNLTTDGNDGTDSISGIERFEFSDTNLAFDLNGNAGTVAKLLGAVFGASAITNTIYAGIGLDFTDGGMSYEELAALAVSVAGATTNQAVVNLLWTNVIGSAPSAEQAQPFVDMLNGGMSVGELTIFAADTEFNANNIGLSGLASTGLAYI